MVNTVFMVAALLLMPYAVLSLVVMVLIELIAQMAALRAQVLRTYIRRMLLDPNGDGLAADFYAHPLVASLSAPGLPPAYIPTRLFAMTLTEVVLSRAGSRSVSEAVAATDGPIKHIFEAFIRNDAGQWGNEVQGWYLAVMDHASGAYRALTRGMVALIGISLVVTFNLDAIRTTDSLWNQGINKLLIESQASAALKTNNDDTSSVTAAIERASGLALPIGWKDESAIETFSHVFMKAIGLGASALAVLIGAPMLFDRLSKYSTVRFQVKPLESFESKNAPPVEQV
jgi:hypothetical protein